MQRTLDNNSILDSKANKVYWLASYPKSGNTWFRAFLTSLLNNNPSPLDINKLNHGQYPNNRHHFDKLNGFNSVNLSIAEINLIRPENLAWISLNSASELYFKTHAAYTYNSNHSPVMGSRYTGVAGAIYLVRNPLDVCISYAHHNCMDIDAAINLMADKNRMSHSHNTSVFLPEYMLSWSEHVNSWTNTSDIDVMVLRYEDMLADPLTSFSSACKFLGNDSGSASIRRAFESCRFENLQAIEKRSAFVEKPSYANRFFRKGIAGDWCNTLSSEQVDRVVRDHSDMMRRFNYLDKNGRPKVS